MISLLINFAKKENKLIKIARLLDYPLMMLCHREIFGFFFRAVYRTVACIIFPSSKFEDRLNLKVLVLINDMKRNRFLAPQEGVHASVSVSHIFILHVIVCSCSSKPRNMKESKENRDWSESPLL